MHQGLPAVLATVDGTVWPPGQLISCFALLYSGDSRIRHASLHTSHVVLWGSSFIDFLAGGRSRQGQCCDCSRAVQAAVRLSYLCCRALADLCERGTALQDDGLQRPYFALVRTCNTFCKDTPF